MYQVVYFKNSRSLSSSIKPGAVLRTYPQLNIAVFDSEMYTFNAKTMNRIITLEDITNIPTGYMLVEVNDFKEAFNYFIGKRTKILTSDESNGSIVVEVPYNVSFDKFRGDTLILTFVESCNIDYIFNVYPSSLKLDRRVRAPRYDNIPYDNPTNWALQNANSREAWNLINQHATSNSPVTITMFDTRVDTGHPDLIGKIDPTSVNYVALYSNDSTEWVNTPVNFIESCGPVWGGNPSLVGGQEGLNRLKYYLHGTGVAGILGGSNSNNILMSSPGNDWVKIRVAVVVDIFTPGITCTQLGETISNLTNSTFGTFSTTLSWQRAFWRENGIYQPNTAAYVLGWDLTEADDYTKEKFNTFMYYTENNRGSRQAPVFVAHGNNNSQITKNDVFGIPESTSLGRAYFVSSSNIFDAKSSFSNYGVDNFIAAPGESVLTTSTRGWQGDSNINSSVFNINDTINPDALSSYLKLEDGTSISAAFVASVYATMVYVRPLITRSQAIDILKETSRKVGDYFYDEDGKSIELGYGIIDHAAAIQAVIDLEEENYDWPGGEPIEVSIVASPGYVFDDLYTGSSAVVAIVDVLDEQVIPLIKSVELQAWVCENSFFDNNTCRLVGSTTYNVPAGQTNQLNQFTQTVGLTATCGLPAGPNKGLFIKAKIYGSNGAPISYGLASDDTLIDVLDSPNSMYCDINGISLEFLGVTSLGNGQPTTSAAGVGWKFRVTMPSNYPYYVQITGVGLRIYNQSPTLPSLINISDVYINGGLYDWDVNMLESPQNGFIGGNDGMLAGDFRTQIFVNPYINSQDMIADIISELPQPVPMKASIHFVKYRINGQMYYFNLSPLAHGPQIETTFTISSWPGLSNPSGSIAG